MTKTYKVLMMLFLLLLWGSGLKALDQKDGVYQIGTADDLVAFSELVNGGEYAASAVLTADIDLSAISYFPPIGKQYYPQGPALSFNGVFDGQGHIIYNLKIDKDDPGAETGLFGRIENATVKNLGIVNATFKNPSALRAGVLGGSSINSNVINCFTTGEINMGDCICSYDSRNGDGLFGLVFTGSILTNCYTTYGTLGNDYAPDIKFENCYWGEKAIAGVSTGELCYKLNGDQNNIVWYQTLVEDTFPTLDNTHKQIYVIGNIKCDGTFLSGEVSYTNDKEAASSIPPHNYIEGVCTECGNSDPGYAQLVDGWYEVSNPEQLLYISALVNSGKFDIKVRLTADIDLSGISYFPPIGKQYYPQGPALSFNGVFDGQGHIIYNLNIDKDDPGAETGLFGRIENATVKNLGIVNATFKNPSALRAGVLGGSSINSNVINCFTTGEINMGDCICSYDSRNGDGLFGLVFTGSILTNCYTTYGTLGNDYAPDIKFENCYWGENVTKMVRTGELCYKLNNSSFINPNWYQTIGEDEFPVLDSTHGIVYVTGDSSYASFPADADFNDFKEIILEIELAFIEGTVATQAILDECIAAIEGLSSSSGKDEFYAAYSDYISLKKKLQESMDAYAAYKQKADEVTAYLEANEGFQGELRNQLVSYLSDDVEPNDDFENGSYVYIMDNHTLTTAEIQAETTKLQAMLDNAIAADYAAGTDITKLLVNADFKDGWNGWNNGFGNGSYYYESVDIVGCEAWNTDGKMEQTIKDLKNGTYLVSMTAAYRPSNDPMSYAYNAYIYLNENCVYIPTVYETYMPIDEAIDGVNCNLSIPSKDTDQPVADDNGETIGYAIHGSPSIAIAAAAGRSKCYMVANVTDGKLTIGVNNPGSKYGSDWTGWANIRLTYLGSMEQADEQLNTVLAGQIERANTLLNKYSFSSDTYYSKSPNFSNALREELTAEIAEAEAATTPEGKYAVVEKFSQTFKDIYTSKRKYIETISNVEDFVSVTSELYPDFISDEENDEVLALSDAAWTDYENGTLDHDKTMALLPKLSFVPQVVDNWYEVATPAQLWYISYLVNSGKHDINVRLTTDIDLGGISYFPPIGKQYYPVGPTMYFSGVFDGQFHVINNLRIEMDDAGAETGLFGRLNGATIQNVGIVNATLKNSNALRAGVLAACAVGSTINNCFTAGEINMEECICSFERRNGDGLVGLSSSGSVISNSYTTYGAVPDGVNLLESSVQNSYWAEDVTNMAPTGELCYRLNGNQQNILWYQTIEEDAYPIFDSTHKQVYAIGEIKCDGTVLSDEVSFTNDKDAATPIPPHHYVEGVCSECGQPNPDLLPIVDGWYEVGTAEQLLYISELVNSGKHDIKFRLTADLDMSGISYFPPIGKQYYPEGPTLYFSGTFDGQGHIIYNLSINKDDAGAETGLFGRLNGAIIQNVGIVNATLKNSNALRAGVLAACALSSKIINCFTAGEINMEECICRFNHRNGSGLIGLITSGTAITNSYTTYGVMGDGVEASDVTIKNCYWGEEAVAGAPTGELCYKLNGDQSTITWFQKLGEDAYPVLNAERGTVIPNKDGNYENATGIKQIADKKQTGHIFNLMGQKVQKVTKGIYIIDGKKVFVK